MFKCLATGQDQNASTYKNEFNTIHLICDFYHKKLHYISSEITRPKESKIKLRLVDLMKKYRAISNYANEQD